MPRKLKRYMVGYDREHETVYGKDELENGHFVCRYADPMTLVQAVKKLRHLESLNVAKTIYKLVPVRLSRLDRRCFCNRRWHGWNHKARPLALDECRVWNDEKCSKDGIAMVSRVY